MKLLDPIQVYEGDGVNPRWKGYHFGDGFGNEGNTFTWVDSGSGDEGDDNGGGEGEGPTFAEGNMFEIDRTEFFGSYPIGIAAR